MDFLYAPVTIVQQFDAIHNSLCMKPTSSDLAMLWTTMTIMTDGQTNCSTLSARMRGITNVGISEWG